MLRRAQDIDGDGSHVPLFIMGVVNTGVSGL